MIDLKEEERYNDIYLISVFQDDFNSKYFNGLISQEMKSEKVPFLNGLHFCFTYLYSSDINGFYLAMKPTHVNGFIHLDDFESINMFSSAIKELYRMAKENSIPILD